ncbi:MAG: hypothetical protein PHX21_05630 [bacterium]|nr:hypothetical protein [bacterium]
MAALKLLLLLSISSIEGKYYFTPLSVDLSPDFFDIHCFSFGIGTKHLLVGTSSVELKKFPGIPSEGPLTGGKYSMELFPINTYLLLNTNKKFNLYGYFCVNKWAIEPFSRYDWCIINLSSYSYFRTGIGITAFSFFRASMGYFNGSFEGSTIYSDTVLLTKFPSKSLYLTVGFSLPDMWKDFKFESRTTNSSFTDIVLQFGGAGVGGILGLCGGAFITSSAIFLTEILGANPDEGSFPTATSFGVLCGGLTGMVIGFPVGFQLTGKFLHINSQKSDSQDN